MLLLKTDNCTAVYLMRIFKMTSISAYFYWRGLNLRKLPVTNSIEILQRLQLR